MEMNGAITETGNYLHPQEESFRTKGRLSVSNNQSKK